MSEVIQKGRLAKQASIMLKRVTTAEKNEALKYIADQLYIDKESILAANQRDLELGEKLGLSDAILERMMLDESRMEAIIESVKLLINLKDPIGEVLEMTTKDNGLKIKKIRVPIGVIGMIYESRPNVTVDGVVLSLKTSNAIILRGSSSTIHSNKRIVQSIQEALGKSPIPVNTVQLIEDPSRAVAKEFFRLNNYLDVLIPRGSEQLINLVVNEATVPVIETGAGNCH